MVEFYERPLAKTILLTGNEGKTVSLEIPRDRFIQEIQLRFTGTYDTAGTAPVLTENNPYIILKSMRLVANGNDILRSLSGYHQMLLNWFDFHGCLLERVPTKVTLSLTDEPFSFSLVLPFKVNPLDPFDVGALLPAMDFSSLDLFVDWGVVADLATNTSDLKGQIEVCLREAFITQDEAEALWGKNWEGLIKNYITEVVKTIDASYGEFKFEHDLPTGMILRRALLKAVNNNIRSDAICSKYKVSQESPVKRDLLERNWYQSQIQDKFEYEIPAPQSAVGTVSEGNITVRGITLIDFEKLPCIDATGLKKGDIKFKANTGTPTSPANFTLVTEEFI